MDYISKWKSKSNSKLPKMSEIMVDNKVKNRTKPNAYLSKYGAQELCLSFINCSIANTHLEVSHFFFFHFALNFCENDFRSRGTERTGLPTHIAMC